MYPHRDYYRSVPTIRSLPIAIKSHENAWSSVTVNVNAHRYHSPDTASIPDSPKTSDLYNPYERYETTHTNKVTYIKEQLVNHCQCFKALQVLFHLSNILHYLIIPYLLVFRYQEAATPVVVYWYGIFNDCIFIFYVTIKCRKRRQVIKWIYNCLLVFPFWLLYAQITNRSRKIHSRWVVNGLDVGFFLCRCIPCPLRLYWTVHLLRGVLNIASYCPMRFLMGLVFHLYLLLHMFVVIWGLLIHIHGTPVNFDSTLLLLTKVTTQNGCPLADDLETKAVLVIFTILALLFFVYLNGMYFMKQDGLNKRVIKLQNFTKTLSFHLRKSKQPSLVRNLQYNHHYIRVHRKSVALNECNIMLANVNWPLVQDVLFDVNLPALKAGTLFSVRNENTDCYVRHLSSKMKRECYNPRELIFERGKPLDKMVVIVEGYVDLLAEDNETSMMCMGPGTCLGQTGLLLNLKAKAAVRCMTYVRLLSLSKKDFLQSTLRTFPETYQAVYRNCNIQMLETRKRQRSMMLRPPQHDYELTIADRANPSLYKVAPCPSMKNKMAFYRNSRIGRVDDDLTMNAMWNYLIVGASVFVGVLYPYYVAFYRDFPGPYIKVISIAIEVLFVADFLLTMITFDSGPNSNGLQKGMKLPYCSCANFGRHVGRKLGHWSFYLDFFAAIFFEHFTYALDPETIDPEQLNFLFYFLKLNRVVKIYKLFHLFTSFHFNNNFYKRLLIHSLTIAAVVYYGGIVLYMTACFQPTCRPDSWFRNLQIREFNAKTQRPLTDDKFLVSVHESLHHLHRWEVHWSYEYSTIDGCLSLILNLLGWALCAWCFMDLTNIQYLQYKPTVFYKRDLHDVRTLAHHHHFPQRLTERLLAYCRLQYVYDPFYFYQYGVNLLSNNYLSKHLTVELLNADRLSTISLVPIFAQIGPKFIEFLTLKSKIYLLPALDTVTYMGNMNKEMFILKRGICVYKTKESYYKRMSPISAESRHSYFGFVSLFFNLPEAYTVKTLTACVFISIDGSALQEALLYYPNFNALLTDMFQTVDYMEARDVYMSMAASDISADYQKVRFSWWPKLKEFLQKSCFINVWSYCTKRKESYCKHFDTEEISVFRYIIIPCTVNPKGAFYYFWVLLRISVAYSYGVTCPLMFVLPHWDPTLYIINIFCDIVLGVDIFVLLHLAFTNSDGILIVHPMSTMKYYGQNGLIIDLFLAIPYEWMSSYADLDESYGFALIRCIKVLQVYKFFVVLAKMKKYNVNLTVVWEVIKCLAWTFLVLNAFAAILIAAECTPSAGNLLECHEHSWLRRSEYFANVTTAQAPITLGDAYLLSFYWSTCVLAGVTFNDLETRGGHNLQLIMLLLLCGIILRGVFIKSLVSFWLAKVENATLSRVVQYQRKLKHLKQFLRQANVDKVLEKKLYDNTIYYWRRTHGIDSTLLFSHLHTTLLQDTLSLLYEDTLRQVPLFQKMDRSFLRIVALIARPMYFLPDQVIINVEDVADEFYIIHEGTVHVELARSSYRVNLSRGSLLGYYCKETTSIMSIIARTVTYVDVLSIKSIDYFNILKNYAKFDGQLKRIMSEYKDFMPNRTMDDNMVNIVISRKKHTVLIVRKMNALLRNLWFYSVLDVIFAIGAFLNALIIPLNFVLHHYWLIFANLSIDIVFLCAFACQFIKPYYNTRGELITNSALIRKYLTHKKRLIIAESLTLALLGLSYGNFYRSHTISDSFPLFALVRLAAMYRCQYFKKSFVEIDDKLFAWKLCNFGMLLVLVLHWLACIWCYVQIYLVKKYRMQSDVQQIATLYADSLLLITNLASTTTTSQRHFFHFTEKVCIILFLIGLKIYVCFLLGKFISLLWIRVMPIVRFNFRLGQLREYLRTLAIDPFQVRNLTRHLVKLERQEFGNNFPLVLTLLPAPLVNELKITLYQAFMEKCYVFHGTQLNFQRNVAVQLQRSLYFKGEIIVHNGEINKCMYFIRKGSVEIVTINENHTETRHDVLHECEMFGLAQGLFKHSLPHQFTFKAACEVEMLILQLERWEHLLRFFPKSKETIYNRIRSVQF